MQSKAEGLFLLASEHSQEMNVCHLGGTPELAVTRSQGWRKEKEALSERAGVERGGEAGSEMSVMMSRLLM